MNHIKKKKSSFVQVANSFIRDNNISFKAKGLFCYMFSMDESWNFTVKSIATQQKDGMASVLSSMKELKEYGYITYTKHQDGTGTYFLDDVPNVENPDVGNPKLGKSTRIKEEQLPKNKNSKHDILLKEYLANNDNVSQSSINYLSDFINYRIKIKKPIKTVAPLNAYIKALKELWTLKYDVKECINIMKENEWQTLKTEYIHKENTFKVNTQLTEIEIMEQRLLNAK